MLAHQLTAAPVFLAVAMEEVTRLVSSGDCVKIWDSASMTVLEQFNPHSATHPVAQVCWSSNSILERSRFYDWWNLPQKSLIVPLITAMMDAVWFGVACKNLWICRLLSLMRVPSDQYLVSASSLGDKLVVSSLKSSAVPVLELGEGVSSVQIKVLRWNALLARSLVNRPSI